AVAGPPVQRGIGQVPGRIAQRQARLGATFLLAVGEGVVGSQAEVIGDTPAAGDFHTADHHLVDVGGTRAAAVTQVRILAGAGAGQRRGRPAGLVVDLVVEAVV